MKTAYDSPTFGSQISIKVDEPINAASISPCNRDIVLASRLGLYIIDLDDPYEPPRFLRHATTWEVADIQWNPHTTRAEAVISTSSQKALVWNLNLPSSAAVAQILHAHTRAITDINWSAHHPDILATCAVDSFIHCWDLRTPHPMIPSTNDLISSTYSKPSISFADFKAGATQVKWNRQNEHLLASSHDRFLYIWDKRKGSIPLQTVYAHETKIYGVDWSRLSEHQIVTCSLDQKVKVWELYNTPDASETDCPSTPEILIHTGFPVWRARNTPFGQGILTMPQRENNSLYLWDSRLETASNQPVMQFDGPTDQVKEFLWRVRGAETDDTIDLNMDQREFQLVAWSKDRHLRLWPLNTEDLVKVGHNPSSKIKIRITRKNARYETYKNEPARSKTQFRAALLPRVNQLGAHDHRTSNRKDVFMTRAGRGAKKMSPINWMKGVQISRAEGESGAESLAKEFTDLGEKYSTRISFEKINIAIRTCCISLKGPWGSGSKTVSFKVSIEFPEEYPSAISIPDFKIEETTDIPASRQNEMLKAIRSISAHLVSRYKPVLEPCIQYLLGERGSHEMRDIDSDTSSSDDDDDYQRPQMEQTNVPMPKGCAAIFSGEGTLVCFYNKVETENRNQSQLTPILNAVDLTKSNIMKTNIDISKSSPMLLPQSDNGDIDSSLPTTPSTYSDDETDSSEDNQTTQGILRKALSKHKLRDFSQNQHVVWTKENVLKGRNVVSMLDLGDIMPVKKQLAQEYMICGPISLVCKHNEKVASNYNYEELSLAWRLILATFEEPENMGLGDYFSDMENDSPKARQIYFAQWILTNLLQHFATYLDIQMMAMIILMLEPLVEKEPGSIPTPRHVVSQSPIGYFDISSPNHLNSYANQLSNARTFSENSLQTSPHTPYEVFFESQHGSPSNTSSGLKSPLKSFDGSVPIPRSNSSFINFHDGLVTARQSYTNISALGSSFMNSPRSNQNSLPGSVSQRHSIFVTGSESSNPTTDNISSGKNKQVSITIYDTDDAKPLLPITTNVSYNFDQIKTVYLEFLDHWGLSEKRAEFLKWAGLPTNDPDTLDISLCCRDCQVKGLKSCSSDCSDSKCMKCDLCHGKIKGLWIGCLDCYHGGHEECLISWFKEEKTCMFGCGCTCVYTTLDN